MATLLAGCLPAAPTGLDDSGSSDAGVRVPDDAGGTPDAGSADAGTSDGGTDAGLSASEVACLDAGWTRELIDVGGRQRKVLWRGPDASWAQGAILVLHGGGGKADDFCTGGPLVQPQLAFSALARARGFAVFALDSTDGVVTDAQGRPCGKRFDFSVLSRANLDLPFIAYVGQQLVPARRPAGSSDKRFITGLSTGGYMTIRAATTFDDWVTAFAPVSAGDPYGTDTICDPSLSPRDSAVGILVDRETRLEITNDGACTSDAGYPNEAAWSTTSPPLKPAFRQFHHASDGIVDLSCMQKATATLAANGYRGAAPALVPAVSMESPLLHLWLNVYNQPLVDYFDAFTP